MFLKYLPPVERELREFMVLADVVEPELNKLNTEILQQLKNSFILTADRRAVRRYEKMLGIPSNEADALEERRFRLILKYNQQPPYTIRTLRKKFDGIYGENGYVLDVSTRLKELQFTLAEGAWGSIRDAYQMLEGMAPLDLIITAYLEINTCHNISNDCSTEISMDFYPRYNLAPLLLDGTWLLDGSVLLGAYKTGERVDFNPMSLDVGIDTKVICTHTSSFDVSVDMDMKAAHEVKTEINMEVDNIVNHDTSTDVCVETYVSHSSDMDVTIKNNYWLLDGSVLLDGSRFLCADEINVAL